MSITNAVLVRLSISQFNNSREDDSITKEVKALHNLTGNAGRWVKIKLREEALGPIRKYATGARADHYRMTLPWIDGQRLLPLTGRQNYTARMDALGVQFHGLVDLFLNSYPEHVEEARKMHGKKFNPDDYPDAEAVRAMFGFAVETTPVPSANHFTAILGTELGRLRSELETANAKRIEVAVSDTWARLLEPVKKLAERLADKDAIFRDTLVSNVRDITGLIPALNVTNDTRLQSAAAEIGRTLAQLDPDTLRNSTVIRREAAEAAGSIVKRFGSLGARKFDN